MSEEKKSVEKKLYEIGFHIIPSVSPEKLVGEVATIKKTLTSNGAEIVKEIEPKLINLAYQMVKKILDANYKFNKAYFGSITFNATATAVEIIKKEIDANNSILRYLLVKTVDDVEHSTNKIAREKSEEIVEADADEVVADDGIDLGDEVVEEEAVVKSEDKSEAKTVDAAIDELVK